MRPVPRNQIRSLTHAYKLLTRAEHIAGMRRSSGTRVGSFRDGKLSPANGSDHGGFKAGRMTGSPGLRSEMAGCGTARRIHAHRLLSLVKAEVVSRVDPGRGSAELHGDGNRPPPAREKARVLSDRLEHPKHLHTPIRTLPAADGYLSDKLSCFHRKSFGNAPSRSGQYLPDASAC